MSEAVRTAENLVLIGFMGCGKSHVGRELHQQLGYPWVDTDTEIEQRAGMSVARIFETQGEAAFRRMESGLLEEMAAEPERRRIVSTGGGIIGDPLNRRLLRGLGFVVWLRAPVEVILERTARNRDRPLLQTEDPEARIRGLMEQREPLYRETAHLAIDTAELDLAEVLTGILESARYHFSRQA